MKEIPLKDAICRLSEYDLPLYDALISDLNLPPVFQRNCKAWMEFDTILVQYPAFSSTGRYFSFAIVPLKKADENLDRIVTFARGMLRDTDRLYFYFPGSAPKSFITGRGVVYLERIGMKYNPPVNIRFLSKCDAVWIEDLVLQSETDTCEFFDIMKCLKYDYDMEYSSEHRIDATRFFLGWFEDDKLIGSISCLKKESSILISNLYVLPRYRRRGIGKHLLKGALSAYPGRRYVYSHSTENVISRMTAESCGFVLCGECVWNIKYEEPESNDSGSSRFMNYLFFKISRISSSNFA